MAVEVAHLLLSLLPDPYSDSSAIITPCLPTTPGAMRVRSLPSAAFCSSQSLIPCMYDLPVPSLKTAQ